MKTYYVYLITNLINGKTYVGQHYGELDDDYYGSGSYINNAINKYGIENFKKEILKECKSREEVNNQEIYFISEFRKIGKAEYNLTSGGEGFKYDLMNMSEETREWLHKRLSERAKNLKRTEEWNKHCSESQKNNPNNPFVKAAKEGYNHFAGKKHTEEAKEKMKKGLKNYYENISEEDYKKLCEHCKEVAGIATKGRIAYIEISTGKRKMFKPEEEIDTEKFMKFSEWSKLHPRKYKNKSEVK